MHTWEILVYNTNIDILIRFVYILI